MYVVCHKCAAAYLVEDGLVVRGDERAQCPNCLHVQALAPPNAEIRPPAVARRARASFAPSADGQAFRVPSIPPVAPAPPPAPALDDSLLNGDAQAQSEPTSCRRCGARLSDAFDRALGICEACRTDAKRPVPRLSPEASQPVVGAETTGPTTQPPETRDFEEPLAADPVEAVPKSLMNAAVKPASRWHAGRIFAAMAVVAALGLGGAALLIARPFPKKAKVAEKAKKVSLSPRLERAREQWRRNFASLQGDAFKYVKEAELELAKDTPSGYGDAEKTFQKAFVLEAEGSQAIAGYLQAVAWGRGNSLDDPELDELINLAEAAELQWGRSARILLARASLALLRPQLSRSTERARSFAQESLGLASGREKALAHLVLSSAFLSSSAELAIQNADLALKLDPALRRAYFQRAAARESLGDYRSAIADLQRRLSLDPDEPSEAKAYLARLYQEVGESTLAYELYQPSAGGSDLARSIARAVIQYQSALKPRAAAQALADGIRRYGQVAPPALLLDAWVHLAAAERLAGRLEAAVNAADQALAISSGYPAANLQLFLVALSRGSVDAAERRWQALKARLGDPALEKVLEGRLLMAQHREAEAMRSFAEAAQLDPRRLDALLLAGAAAASAGRRDEALRYLVVAGQMDPTRTAPGSTDRRFYLAAEENLAGAEGRVIRLAKGSTDVTPRLYESLIRFHQRDLRPADKLLQQVVDVDTGNALALALRALIALHQGSLALARTAAERAVAVGRGVSVAHYAYGSVLIQSGRLEEARTELRQAEALAPKLLAAQVKLAVLEGKKASAEAARARLLHVLRIDPSYLAAKRALYALER